MKQIILVFAMLYTINTVLAEPLEFSGFADFLLTQPLNDDSTTEVEYGQFEVDLSAMISSRVTFEGAIALNPETGGFEVGAGFLDIRLGENENFGLALGQFDVPFGLDWQHIASPDRRLVTAPLMNEKSINGWNDMGVNLTGDLWGVQANGFLANGADAGFALGGRLALSPLDALEIGSSYFTHATENESGSRPTVFGVDIQTITGPLSTRSEFQSSMDLVDGDFEAITGIPDHQGFYTQADLDLVDMLNRPLVFIARYGSWSAENSNSRTNRYTLGFTYTLTESFELRAQYLNEVTDGESENSNLTVQTVVSF